MMRSMYSAVSGLKAHQTRMDVIGNNIANVNTYGFKASRVVFSDVLYQNLSTATGATATTGGTNASQLGYGAKVASIDMLNTISSGASKQKIKKAAYSQCNVRASKNAEQAFSTQ